MSSDWYALAVQQRKEAYVEGQLVADGFRIVCPRYNKIVRHARQTKTVLAPLFPGYLFIELDLGVESWRRVNWRPGCIGLVKFGTQATPLKQNFVDQFILDLGPDGLADLGQDLKIGDQVQAVGGPFDRFRGEIIALSEADRVRILMDALGRKVEATLPRNALVAAA